MITVLKMIMTMTEYKIKSLSVIVVYTKPSNFGFMTLDPSPFSNTLTVISASTPPLLFSMHVYVVAPGENNT